MKVVLYTRVSTGDQSCELQLSALRKYAAERDWEIVGEYVDQVTGDVNKRINSGKKLRYDELMQDAEKGIFQAVLVWKFDRFARSVIHLVSALEKFQGLKVDFISVTQNIDTTTPSGRLFFHMMAAIAEFERHLIAERVRAGLRLVQETGFNSKGEPVTLGRPEEVSQDVKRVILEDYVAGTRLKEIAELAGVPLPTVYSIIKRSVLPCVHGKYRCNPCRKLGRIPLRLDTAAASRDVETCPSEVPGDERVRAS